MSEQDGSGSSVCRACGMCCDGTIFSRVTLREADEVMPLLAAGFEIRDERGKWIFEQRCSVLDGTMCGVYERRPSACRAFSCKLLRSVEAHEATVSDALTVVSEIRERRDSLRADLLSTMPAEASQESLWAVFARFAKGEESVPPSDRFALGLEIAAFRVLVAQHIHEGSIGVLSGSDDKQICFGEPSEQRE
jgi:Fe-S-cluster containining protein